jgi:hypothetical protein
MKLWKALGVAGLAGVAATGAIIARNQRVRAQLTPEQVRARLHERVDRLERAGQSGQAGGEDGRGPGESGPSGRTASRARA